MGIKPGFGGASGGAGGGSGTVSAGNAGDQPIYTGATTIGPVVVPAVKTTSYTPAAAEEVVGYDATGGALAPVLPAATGTGRRYFLFKVDVSANAVTVTRAGSDTIDGSANKVLSGGGDYVVVRDYAAGKWKIESASGSGTLTAAFIAALTDVSSPSRTSTVPVNEAGTLKEMTVAQILGLIQAGDVPAHNHAGTDITSSVVGTQFGGTGSNLVSTGPGKLVQASNGSVVTTQSFVDSSRHVLFDDFDYYCNSASSTTTEWSAVSTSSGTLANVSGAGVDTTGVWSIGAGTTTATGGEYISRRGYIRISNGIITMKFRIRIPTLSTGSNEFVTTVGLTSYEAVEFTAIKPTIGIFFEYDRTNSVNWVLVGRASGASQTRISSGVAVATNTWQTLNITINAAGTSVSGDVDGTGGAPVTTTLPSTAQVLNHSLSTIGSVGTAARNSEIDYYAADYQFTASRG